MSSELVTTQLLFDPSLVAYYRQENGALTVDGGTNNYTLVNYNSVSSDVGLFGYGADFGGTNTNKYLGIASNLGITFGGAKTFGGWFKLNTDISSGAFTFIELRNANRSSSQALGYEYNSGTRRVYFQRYSEIGTAVLDNVYHNINLGTDDWHHILFTYDTTNIIGYVDGDPVGTTTSTALGTGTGVYSDGFGIAAYASGGNYSPIKTDDVVVFNRALTSSEISNLYNGWPGASRRLLGVGA